MAVLGTDQQPTSGAATGAPQRTSNSAEDGGFSAEWSEENPQRTERRRRVEAAAAATANATANATIAATADQSQAPVLVTEDVDDDEESE